DVWAGPPACQRHARLPICRGHGRPLLRSALSLVARRLTGGVSTGHADSGVLSGAWRDVAPIVRSARCRPLYRRSAVTARALPPVGGVDGAGRRARDEGRLASRATPGAIPFGGLGSVDAANGDAATPGAARLTFVWSAAHR